MVKSLVKHGNSYALVIDKPLTLVGEALSVYLSLETSIPL